MQMSLQTMALKCRKNIGYLRSTNCSKSFSKTLYWCIFATELTTENVWRTVVSLTLFLFGDDDVDVNGDDDVDGNGDDDDLYIYDADAHGPCLFVRHEKSSLCKKVCLSLCVTKNDHFANLAVCLSRKIIPFCICLSVCHVFFHHFPLYHRDEV